MEHENCTRGGDNYDARTARDERTKLFGLRLPLYRAGQEKLKETGKVGSIFLRKCKGSTIQFSPSRGHREPFLSNHKTSRKEEGPEGDGSYLKESCNVHYGAQKRKEKKGTGEIFLIIGRS